MSAVINVKGAVAALKLKLGLEQALVAGIFVEIGRAHV